jgi:hypothetical protein
VTDLSTVSSDDVIASYQQQLSDAHHRLAILEAKLAKAMKYINEQRAALPEPADGGKK